MVDKGRAGAVEVACDPRATVGDSSRLDDSFPEEGGTGERSEGERVDDEGGEVGQAAFCSFSDMET